MLLQENYETILIEKRDGIAIASLNRPEVFNAFNGPLHRELEALPNDFDTDPDLRVLVLTGTGPHFSSGADFSTRPDGEAGVMSGYLDKMHRPRLLVDNMLDCEKPIVTAVNGAAIGPGATIALLGDVVIAARSAFIADPHVLIGSGAGDGGQVIWPLLIGVNRAKYYMMTGERVPAEEAERIGLVNFVVDDDELMNKAMEIAMKLAKGPAYAIMASKVPLNKYIKFMSNLVLPLSLAMEEISHTTDDYHEARSAFIEKREPHFTGR